MLQRINLAEYLYIDIKENENHYIELLKNIYSITQEKSKEILDKFLKECKKRKNNYETEFILKGGIVETDNENIPLWLLVDKKDNEEYSLYMTSYDELLTITLTEDIVKDLKDNKELHRELLIDLLETGITEFDRQENMKELKEAIDEIESNKENLISFKSFDEVIASLRQEIEEHEKNL